MFRRLFWMVVGAGLALYSRSKVVQAIERYVPAPIARAVHHAATRLRREVRQRLDQGAPERQ
jgi:hypothetical protein